MMWSEIEDLLANVQFRDWQFRMFVESKTSAYLQIQFVVRDPRIWANKVHRGRKWRLSLQMTKGEILQTALKAVLTALEHEAREEFLYRDVAIYGPHIDPDALCEIANRTVVRNEHAQGLQ